MIKSIAIFGATDKYASAVAEGLALDNTNQLLLVADQESQLNAFRDQILKLNPLADIEITDCASDASWQADIILLALCRDLQKLISGLIEGFVTQKTLIAFVDSRDDVFECSTANVLQELLPNTHIVSAYLTEDMSGEKIFYASGLNEAALEEAINLLISAGFNTAISKNQIN